MTGGKTKKQSCRYADGWEDSSGIETNR